MRRCLVSNGTARRCHQRCLLVLAQLMRSMERPPTIERRRVVAQLATKGRVVRRIAGDLAVRLEHADEGEDLVLADHRDVLPLLLRRHIRDEAGVREDRELAHLSHNDEKARRKRRRTADAGHRGRLDTRGMERQQTRGTRAKVGAPREDSSRGLPVRERQQREGRKRRLDDVRSARGEARRAHGASVGDTWRARCSQFVLQLFLLQAPRCKFMRWALSLPLM